MESSTPKQRHESLLSVVDETSPVPPETEKVPQQGHPPTASPPSTEKSFCQLYLQDCMWPGLGLFGESYLLFSVGTLQPLWKIVFPRCFDADDDESWCREMALHGVSTSTVTGIILGMTVVGRLAQTFGRRSGSILTAAFMTAGAIVLTGTAVWGGTGTETMVWRLCAGLFLFGIGVGGEYPLAASSASEKAMTPPQQQQDPRFRERDDGDDKRFRDATDNLTQQQQHRGRQIQLVFSMQGMGIFCNSIVMTSLLVLYGQTDANEYQTASLLQIWRWTYAFGLAVLVFVLVSRYLYLRESTVWQQDKERRDRQERLEQPTAAREHHETSSVDAPGTDPVAIRVMDVPSATGEAAASPGGIPPQLVSPQSDVSSLSAPSLAAMEFEEHGGGGAFLALKEEPSGEDMAEDAQLPVWTLLLKHFGMRLLGVSSCWFLWDVAFYGNKLFQSSFLLALTGQGGEDDEEPISLLAFSLAATLNAGVALLGYLGAAVLVDHPSIGRRQLQQWGFFVTGSLFVACGFFYHSLSSAALVILYLGSSFFGQLGPNATTFVLPAEVFPTQVRTSCHGMAAAAGKAGALTAAVFFPLVDSELDLFLLSGYASLAASVVTFWTIPETTGLDLWELDRKWRLILTGRRGEYHGPANHPRFLSYWERRQWSVRNQQQQTSEEHFDHAMDDF